MRDSTGSGEADAVLANRDAHLANLYALSGAGLAETDSNGRFVSVNDRYCEIVGRGREELLRMRLHDITDPEDHQQDLPLFARLAVSSGPVLLDERYVRGDGSMVWVTKTATPIRIEGTEPIALVVAIDVTERKAAEAALRESEARLLILQNELAHIARVNDLGEMAVAIAHEINQPLTAIANYLNAGRMVVADECTAGALAAAREAMALAEEQALRAGKIIHSLREFAKKRPWSPARRDRRLAGRVGDGAGADQGSRHGHKPEARGGRRGRAGRGRSGADRAGADESLAERHRRAAHQSARRPAMPHDPHQGRCGRGRR